MKGVTVWSRRWTAVTGAGAVAATAALLALSLSGSAFRSGKAAPAGHAAQVPAGSASSASASVAPQAAARAAAQRAAAQQAPAAAAEPQGSAGPAAAPQGSAGPVVALGDSYTAGDLLPLSFASPQPGCLRSPDGYAVQVAKALGAQHDFVDAACGGAGVKEMGSSQKTYLGTNPPQLSALASDDRLVMLTLGGDDLGFLNALDTCMELSITDLFGSPCKNHYTSGGTDQLAAKVTAETAKVAAVLVAIRTLAPRALVLLVGYPDLFPQQSGCWPVVPITDGDVAYLRGIEMQLNSMLAEAATAAGATFVDTYAATTGHDFCQDASVKDVEGLIPTSLTAPFHPNTRGQTAMAAAVLAAVRAKAAA